jgi:hypothetical protein
MDIKNMQESINTIMATTLSDEKKNSLVAELLSASINNTVVNVHRKQWTDEDTVSVFTTVINNSKQSGEWSYGRVSTLALTKTIKELTKTLGRTESAVKAHINNAISTSNLTPTKTDNGGITRLVHYKQLALKTGLINLDTYMTSLNKALKCNAITVAELQGYLDVNNNNSVIDIVVPDTTYKHTVNKVNLKKRVIVHYTHEERVKLFTLIKAELGTYEELCDIFNCSVISYNQVPKEIWDALKKVAKELGNGRTASAVKGQMNTVTHKILNPDDVLTKGKMDTVNAAIEAGFVDGVTA